jgi:alpha-amylase/alpha-mannosidase (GH57 family)
MEKYVCIHGHFYQPPRDNPWLEDIELQDQAYPYHDWNERITDECYRPNAASRILGSDRKIINIVNNYANISFNFGPTLLSWLEAKAPDVYEKILEADQQSMERFSGHGAALAQAYNHMILPLCNAQDKRTQVIWGIKDFESRFHRQPEGMWLPETAVNTDTLEVLAEHGIRFTILSPQQAVRIRKIGVKQWKDVTEGTLDTTTAYVCRLPSGNQITLFFYNGPIAHEVAFGGLLHNGQTFAERMYSCFTKEEKTQLVHIATDGESFGHHHRHGDMALAYCIHHLQTHTDAKLTIYGEFLEKFPPEYEVQIKENSSWSCAHGVERWRSNCGCCSDPALKGKQQWREPLRGAMDWLRDQLGAIYTELMQPFVQDPWAVRNAYIEIILDRRKDAVKKKLDEWTGRDLSDAQISFLLKLLEMQRNAQLMYTSCGWYFNDISGIETIQILQYAGRAMQLCRDVKGIDLEPEFRDRLEKASSLDETLGNGKIIYDQYVKPAMIDLTRVGAHLALSSIFQSGDLVGAEIYTYSAAIHSFQRLEAGIETLITAYATLQANTTWEQGSFFLVGLYLGGQNVFAAAGPMPPQHSSPHKEQLCSAFRNGDTSEVLRLMNVFFSGCNYSIQHLFRDEQRRILDHLLETTWKEIEYSFRRIYEYNYSMMQLMIKMKMPLPQAFLAPAEYIVNEDLCRLIHSGYNNTQRIKKLLEDVRRFSLKLNHQLIQYEFNRKATQLFQSFKKTPEDLTLLMRIEELLGIIQEVGTELNLQNPQNIFFTLARHTYPVIRKNADAGDEQARQWVEHFEKLARQLNLVIA